MPYSRAIQTATVFLGMLLFAAPAGAHEHHPLHDAGVVIHDVKATDHALHDIVKIGHDMSSADRETAKLWRDAERADGLITPSIHRPHDHGSKHDELSNAERDLQQAERDYRDVKKAECDRLHAEYALRHPPGTKPQGLSGKHGCALYKQDAHFHDKHPDIVSILGANIYVGLDKPAISW